MFEVFEWETIQAEIGPKLGSSMISASQDSD